MIPLHDPATAASGEFTKELQRWLFRAQEVVQPDAGGVELWRFWLCHDAYLSHRMGLAAVYGMV